MASRIEQCLDTLSNHRVIAVVRARHTDGLIEAARCLDSSGIACIEIAMTTPEAPSLIRRLCREIPHAVIGAGTVLTAHDAEVCVEAGAQFIVSPIFDPFVVDVCSKEDIVVIAGALTPSEIVAAWRGGANMVKVFPAARLGPDYISDLRGPLPEIPLVPTGGITAGNARDYLRAGANLVCVGGWLLGSRKEPPYDHRIIKERAKEILDAVGARRFSDE